MGPWARDSPYDTEMIGTSPPQLAKQVIPFELELAARGEHRRDGASSPEFAAIKAITTACTFVVDRAEICVDRGRGRRGIPESVKLRMVTIPTGRSRQDCLCKERFAPERHEPRTVEIGRMESPESHVTKCRGAA